MNVLKTLKFRWLSIILSQSSVQPSRKSLQYDVLKVLSAPTSLLLKEHS